MTSPDELIDELRRERDAFFSALGRVDRSSLATPGLVGDWSAREVIAHLGYWVGHGVEAIHAVETGRADDFGQDRPSVDELNETVARVAREADVETVRRREAASYEALVERLRQADATLLETFLPHHRITLGEAVREDGADHYREHAKQLRDILEATPHG